MMPPKMMLYSSTQDLLSSLPREEGINSAYSYQYQGFWYGPLGLQGLVDCQQHFQARKNDIFLVTSPKSGTTWLKAVLNALINRDSCCPQDPHHPLRKIPLHQLVPFLELLMPPDYDSVSNSSDNRINRIFSCHIPTVSLPISIKKDAKIVYLCRDIKDIFVSHFHFSINANFRPSLISLEKAFDLFCKGVSLIGPVWDHILEYWKESQEKPDKVLFMRYEEIKDEPHVPLRRIAHFLEKPFSQKEEKSGLLDEIIQLCSFDSMSKLEVNKTGTLIGELKYESFFRNGVVGDWKNYLTAEMACKLDQITIEKFSGSGLSMT